MKLSSDIKRSLLKVVDSYGKIGVLIDDAPEARSRAARAIYGMENLPRWWMVGRSLPCACSLLGSLKEVLSSQNDLLAIAIVDRYLLVSCEQESPVAWDGLREGLEEQDRDLCDKIEMSVRRLNDLRSDADRYTGFFFELETSYPHGFWSRRRPTGKTKQEPLPWKTRSTDLLYRLRGRIEQRGLRTLLEYGPSEQPPLNSEDPAPRWRARLWRPTLEALAAALKHQSSKQPVILFTGAGASLRSGRLSRGMPATDRLLEDACLQVAGNSRERFRSVHLPPEPAPEPLCVCGTISRTVPPARVRRQKGRANKSETPVEKLVSHVVDGQSVAEYDWYLERLFSAKLNTPDEPRKKLFRQFCDAFRSALHRHDHGFPYHHWLLAQLPWTRIITTNFDGFHERAAETAAASQRLGAAERDHILSLGSRLPNVSHFSVEQLTKLREGRRLFKPYGSLLFPAELDLGFDQLKKCQDRLQAELESLLKVRDVETAWLVVIGHSMRDPYIDKQLGYLERLPKAKCFPEQTRFLWVVPDALERSLNASPGSGADHQVWDGWMYELWSNGEGDSGPLPARASEFAHDLWQTYRRPP